MRQVGNNLIKVLMKTSYVFFADGFEEIEALTVIDVLRRAGIPVKTVSINPTVDVVGAHGVKVAADTTFGENNYDDAEWIIFPGGMPGASNLAACEPLVNLINKHYQKNGKIAAICASPSVILGPLGILNGRNAVCYPGMEHGMKGAKVGFKPVVTDGNVITGNGPAAATQFALTIVSHTIGEAKSREVGEGMLVYSHHSEFYF